MTSNLGEGTYVRTRGEYQKNCMVPTVSCLELTWGRLNQIQSYEKSRFVKDRGPNPPCQFNRLLLSVQYKWTHYITPWHLQRCFDIHS
jgi:hypothetical protein